MRYDVEEQWVLGGNYQYLDTLYALFIAVMNHPGN